jgi:FkbM family methyltransferase
MNTANVDPVLRLVRRLVENQAVRDLRRLRRYQEILAFVQSLEQAGLRPLIVDAGANIGATSVYLALTFPSARVVAVEPEPGNFALLTSNVVGSNVCCLQAAISSQSGRTRVIDPGEGHWGYRTGPAGAGPEVARTMVSQIYREQGPPPYHPFLVKVDIEGGEKDLFEASTDWVGRTPLLIVELHDWLLPRQGTALPFLRCVSALDRDFVHIGENVYSIANHLELQKK